MKKTLFLFLAFVTICGLCSVRAQFVIPQVPAELQETVNGYVQTLLQDPTDETVMKSIDKNKLLKKDKEALIAVGYKFLDNKLFGNAIGLAKKVYDMDPTFVPAVYLEGDAYFAMKNNNAYGLAAQKYEEAKTIDANSLDPYLKLVGVYRYINPDYAIELMNEIKDKKGDDPKVNQVLGTLYFQLSDTVKARTFYNKYFETYPDGQGDVTVQREYVIILFMAKDYKGALNMSKKFQATNPNDPVLSRIEFLSKFELQQAYVSNVENQFAPGFEQKKDSLAADTKVSFDKFFTSYPDSVYQELDYRYKAQYLAGLNDHKGAIAAYIKSAEIAPDNYSTQFNLSKEYEKVKDYDKAISSYRKYMELADKTEDVNEEFKLARIYYNAANGTKTDSLLRVKYIKGGDSLYAHVDNEMLKEAKTNGEAPSYLAVFWRSRINQLYDRKVPNEIAAKYMKETIERLKNTKFAGEEYNGHRAQAYAYLAWFEMDKNNDEAKANAVEALKYEEDNALASNVKKYLEILGKW